MYKTIIYSLLLIALLAQSCRKEDLVIESSDEELIQPEIPDWTDETHAELTTPNYSVVFNQEEVLRFDIKIDAAYWAEMQADLQANLGSSSGGRPGGQVTTNTSDFDPIWVPCSFYFDSMEWYKVGVRFKGNSSLSSAYSAGIEKLSFKLDFEQYEDDYPILENQRFYGFKQLNLKNNYDDASMMREKVASDLFREFGLASPEVAFCELYVDFGNGSQYFGVYSLVEEVDDSVIETQFEIGGGNLYKPDGDAASFANGTYNDSEMEKKSNEDVADYTDVIALYNAVNNSTRTTDEALWKSGLENTLDVDVFLKWLAANTVMQNWDTYGRMTHNYYLYNNPSNNKLTWIPWDNNEALQDGKGGTLSLSLNEVGSGWPLISYLIAVDEYSDIYKNYVSEFTEEVFYSDKMDVTYSDYYELLKESAYAEEPNYTFLSYSTQFDAAVEELKSHVVQRNNEVDMYLE